MKIAILGASSLLASYIKKQFLLEEGNDIWLFSRQDTFLDFKDEVKFQEFNYPEAVPNFASFLSFDLIVYCAATGVQAGQTVSTEMIYELNAFFPIRLLNYLNDNNFLGKWISFGSYFEIGNNNSEHAFSEEEVVASMLPIPNHYCASKRLLTRFINANQLSIKAYHFILPTIYGVKESSKRLIPYIINALREQCLPKLSSGTQVRQYIHCEDVAVLVSMVALKDYSLGIYNVAGSGPIQIAQLVQTIFSLFDKDATAYLGTITTRDEGMRHLALSSKRISTEINAWQPLISLNDGIAEYLQYG